MSRIRMAVELRNETGTDWHLAGSNVEWGEWTPGWSPPATIPAGGTAEWRSEGDLALVPTTGTEGRASYRSAVAASETVDIHWNSPLIESQYGNTFQVRCPSGFEAAHWGGQGHEGRLTVRLRPTADRVVPGFSPAGNGLRFANSWDGRLPAMTVGLIWNRLLDSLPDPLDDVLGITRMDDGFLPITQADAGLCGGMVFTVMDLWHSGIAPPDIRVAPTSESDMLYRFIRDRLWDSFDVLGGGHRILAYSSPHYPNGDEGAFQFLGLTRGRSWVTYRDEWPKVRDDIDAGRLSPLVLIQTQDFDIGINHQVLAYGYRQSGQHVTLFVYDPNLPDTDVRFTFDYSRTDGEVHIARQPDGKRIFAFFRNDGYQAKQVPWALRPLTSLGAGHLRNEVDGHCSVFGVQDDGRVMSQFWPDGATTNWTRWFPIGDNVFPAGSPLSVIKTRTQEGACTLFLSGLDGRVWSAHWPDGDSVNWSGWYAVGDGIFPVGASITAIRTRSEIEGACTLFGVAPGGQVWSAFWPHGASGEWSGWFPIGDNTFPPGAPVSAIRTRGVEGACSLFVVGHDGRVWSTFWPDGNTGNWSGWFPIGDNTFPVGARIAAMKTRSDDGSCTLFVIGHDGRVWSTFWPDAGTPNWSGWFPIGDGRFPPGAPVTAVKTRLDVEGSCSLFAVAPGGQVWSCFWPDGGTPNWSGWFPIGENTFPPGSTITAVRTRNQPGACSLFVIGSDGRPWSAYWPQGDTSDWSGWFRTGENTLVAP